MALEDIAKTGTRDKSTVIMCTQELFQFGICNKGTGSLKVGG
ncbi:MAG: hypothetical protein WA421_20110 [Nitrososphaeraceae archaeon]